MIRNTEENAKETLIWIIHELNRRVTYCSSIDMSTPRVVIVEKSVDHLLTLLECLYHNNSLSRSLFNTLVRLVTNIDNALISNNWVYKSIHIRKNETKSAEYAIKHLPDASLSCLKHFYRYYNATSNSILDHYYHINADLYTQTELIHDLLDKIDTLYKNHCTSTLGHSKPHP